MSTGVSWRARGLSINLEMSLNVNRLSNYLSTPLIDDLGLTLMSQAYHRMQGRDKIVVNLRRACRFKKTSAYAHVESCINAERRLNSYTPCLRKKQSKLFCHNFVRFLLTLIIYRMMMIKTTKLCKVYSFSTSPNLCQCTTM